MTEKNSFYVVIPARYASSRLPGKMLMDLAGKPMIQHVYERAQKSLAEQVIIATDDERIADAAKDFGATVCMTSSVHLCGTDRIAEVTEKLGWIDEDIVINVQGDEPFISPQVINQVAQNLTINKKAVIATLCEPLRDVEQLFDPNVVKVVVDQNNYALYFSRAPIPWDRNKFVNGIPSSLQTGFQNTESYYCHLGIYAYRCGFLREYVKLPVCSLELIESLEQLRALWHGYKIHVAQSCAEGMLGIDTMDDLFRARRILKKDLLQ